MKPVFQTHFDEFGTGPGNCMQAVVASLLELPLECVPNFIEVGTGDPFALMRDYLHVYGIDMVRTNAWYSAEGLYFATGTSTQGYEHIIIERTARLVHDPNPHGRGLVHHDAIYELRPRTVAAAALVR